MFVFHVIAFSFPSAPFLAHRITLTVILHYHEFRPRLSSLHCGPKLLELITYVWVSCAQACTPLCRGNLFFLFCFYQAAFFARQPTTKSAVCIRSFLSTKLHLSALACAKKLFIWNAQRLKRDVSCSSNSEALCTGTLEVSFYAYHDPVFPFYSETSFLFSSIKPFIWRRIFQNRNCARFTAYSSMTDVNLLP